MGKSKDKKKKGNGGKIVIVIILLAMFVVGSYFGYSIARNGGGLTRCSCYNFRTRHGKIRRFRYN